MVVVVSDGERTSVVIGDAQEFIFNIVQLFKF